MKKTIMLLFLSDVKLDSSGQPMATVYDGLGAVHTTNESAVRYLQRSLEDRQESLDGLFMFVSDKVAGNMQYRDGEHNFRDYIDAQGSPCSHVEYFKRRIQDILSDGAGSYVEVPFHESCDPAASMESIMTMAESIQAYLQALPQNTQVTLHADCTGGLRHANMMMMAVMRLMQYSGVEIGQVLYSNFNRKVVESAESIYELFDIISGAEEFANFGSVKAINRYFEHKEMPEELASLLQAMNRFSEEIRLCHIGQLVEAAQELSLRLKEFQKYNGACIEARLMHQLEAKISKDYQELLEDGFSTLKLIRWCLKHDYLQQALTLYTETVPEFIYNQGFFRLSEDADKQRVVKGRKSENGELLSDGFFMLTVFDGTLREVKQKEHRIMSYWPMAEAQQQARAMQEEISALVKDFLPNKYDARTAIDVATLKRKVGEILAPNRYIGLVNQDYFYGLIDRLEQWRQKPILLKQPEQDDSYYQELHSRLGQTMEKPYGGQSFTVILNHIKSMSNAELEKLVVKCDVEYAFRFMSFLEPEYGYFQLHERLAPAEMRQLLNVYGSFKSERNNSNHARMKLKLITSAELKEKMQAALEYLEALDQRLNGK